MIEQLPMREILAESEFLTSRSGGPGGQHVNKVSSRVTLKWNVVHSRVVDEEQKSKLVSRLGSRLTREGELVIVCQTSRSQHENKAGVKLKLAKILADALREVRARRKTRPTSSSVTRRLESKRRQSERKSQRRKRGEE